MTLAFDAGFLLTGCIIPWPLSGEVLVAPDVRGRVLDAATQKPVAFAQVMVDRRSDTFARTDAGGTFHITELRKAYRIEFIEPGGVMPSSLGSDRIYSHP